MVTLPQFVGGSVNLRDSGVTDDFAGVKVDSCFADLTSDESGRDQQNGNAPSLLLRIWFGIASAELATHLREQKAINARARLRYTERCFAN